MTSAPESASRKLYSQITFVGGETRRACFWVVMTTSIYREKYMLKKKVENLITTLLIRKRTHEKIVFKKTMKKLNEIRLPRR